jgi:hypothetical protein
VIRRLELVRSETDAAEDARVNESEALFGAETAAHEVLFEMVFVGRNPTMNSVPSWTSVL